MKMDKIITKLVKEHNKERNLEEFNKGLKFLSMNLYNKEGYDNFVTCYNGVNLTRYEVKFVFKPENKWDNNIVKYQMNMYSNGEIGFYFDGTSDTRFA